MGAFLTVAELMRGTDGLTAELADEIITDIEALAVLEAPCLVDPAFQHHDAVRAILRQAARRWHKSGTGVAASEQMTNGPFSFMQTTDTRHSSEGQLWPSEVRKLQKLCRIHNGTTARRKAFTVTPGRR